MFRGRLFLTAFVVLAVFGSQVLEAQDLALTVYNNGQAMVKDTRKIQFDKGVSKVYFTDVASTIETETVMFTPNNQTGNITIYEQNFENNLAGKYSILKNYIGKNISVDISQGNSVKNINGRLLSYSSGFLLESSNGVNIYDSVSAVRVPQLPEGLLIQPTLVWVAFSLNPVTTNCEVAYRASGINWKADYLMVLNQDENQVDFSGWVTIDNNSGKKYENTKIKLIAGDVNTASQPQPMAEYAVRGVAFAAPEPAFAEKSFGDYHMYTLDRKVNLN
jgi:hypothetical protein